VRTITSLVNGAQNPRIATTVIARDGQKRREEFDSSNGEKIASLTTPAGSFVLLPGSKIFAAIGNSTPAEVQSPSLETELSADRLLNEISVETRYQKLGSENVNGRQATKYRVLTTSLTQSASSTSETMIWIDDALGLPIRWETKAISESNQAQTRMELTQISLDPGPQMFELPKDYRKVEMAELVNVMQGRKPAETPKTVKK
jgi:outer membrane lipoprotein-sorting protein